MPVTSLDSTFTDHITAMEDVSIAAADATNLIGQRKWMYPPPAGWSGDTRDITGMTAAFDRTVLNDQYETLINNVAEDAAIGEVMVTKIQVDYVAALERAFRTRHCSPVRARIHAAGRRRGQGDAAGPLSGSLIIWLQRLLQAAHDT